MTDDEVKRLYQVWSEYLKENEYYELFCKWVRAIAKITPNLDLRYRKIVFAGPSEKYEDFASRGENPTFMYVPVKLKNCGYYTELTETYTWWGDIHDDKHLEFLFDKLNNNVYYFPGIINNGNINQVIVKYIAECEKHYQTEKKKIPTLEEVKNFFKETENFSKPFLTLSIPLDTPKEILISQFDKIITDLQKEWEKEKAQFSIVPFPEPSKTISIKDIEFYERYLQVYRLKDRQGLSWKEVIEKLDPKGEIHPSERNLYDPREWRKERDNARDIIKNVGQNIFPGEYGWKRRKERKLKNRTTK